MVNYPNGRSRAYSTVPKKKKSLTELSVTKKSTSKTKGMVAFGKRGMNFEAEINATNEYYLSRGLAVIHKKPTPIQIVKVDYPQRSRAKITEATSGKHLLLTTLESIKVTTSTLKQRKHSKKLFSL